MEQERWKQLDNLLHAAMEHSPDERDGFLRDACARDEALEQEARSLLKSGLEAGSFMETPAIEIAARAMARQWNEGPLNAAGSPFERAISHYRVLEELGRGGMGVVYKAEDSRLKRRVALKFLSDQFAREPMASDRFQREAQAASCLNHPGICTVYDIGEQDGQPFLVMEYLEGETLRHRIHSPGGKGPLDMQAVLAIGVEITDALSAAHHAGIIHRDLKPANIFLTEAGGERPGRVKIVDFGLAQLGTDNRLTNPGTALGTAFYMSPEQALGVPADARTDLFSLGLVLYEMATGRVPSPGVNLSALPTDLARIVSRCLENDRELRYQDAAQIRADLQRLKAGPSAGMFAAHWKAITPIAAVVVATCAIAYSYLHRSPGLADRKLTDKDTVVLADFMNSTGDQVFDGTLRRGVAVQLEQSPFLALVSEERLRDTLRMMERPADAHLSPELAREVCERTGSAAVLDGSITNLGGKYVLELRARNCRAGDVLYHEQLQPERKEDVLGALSEMTGKLRAKLGESLEMIREHSIPLNQATTQSLDAWKAFSMGLNMSNSAGHLAAVPLLERAVGIDPKFATAYAWLGRDYGAVGEVSRAVEATTKAWQFRDRANDQERFYIDFSYYKIVQGDLEKAVQTCELWAQTYPRDPRPHGFLGSSASTALGRYEMAAEASKKVIELDPGHSMAYANLASAYIYLNRLPQAEDTLRRADARKLAIPDFLIARYLIAFLRADEPEMKRFAGLGEESPELADWMLDHEASNLAYSGRLRLARIMSQRAVHVAGEKGRRDATAQHRAGAAVREALFGNMREARRFALLALRLSTARDAEYGAALALALTNNLSEARALADDLAKRFHEDTVVRFSYLPVLRAVIAMNHREPRKAIELLQAARTYELGFQGCCSVGFAGSLYPIYVRGEALLAANQGAEAAGEFQKILDHRGIVVTDPISALAHLQLGRAFVKAQQRVKAKTAYEEFLALWRDADPNVPILKKAKAEYLALQ